MQSGKPKQCIEHLSNASRLPSRSEAWVSLVEPYLKREEDYRTALLRKIDQGSSSTAILQVQRGRSRKCGWEGAGEEVQPEGRWMGCSKCTWVEEDGRSSLHGRVWFYGKGGPGASSTLVANQLHERSTYHMARVAVADRCKM
eukprot:363864-Chlamydomonas_euryale.AAC.3